jgi:hypothetical protein
MLAILSDIPPIKEGANASFAMAWNIANAVGKENGILITRSLHRNYRKKIINNESPIETVFYPDCSLIGLRKYFESLRYLLDLILFFFYLPVLLFKIRKYNIQKTIAFSYNHWIFLVNAWLFKIVTRRPLELYLVDDLESSARHKGKTIQATLARISQRFLLNKYDKVHLISEGYIDFIYENYKVRGSLLPVVLRSESCIYSEHFSEFKDIAYVGSINYLYMDSLFEIAEALTNDTELRDKKFRLVIYSNHIPLAVRMLSDNYSVVCAEALSNEDLSENLRKAYACILPYSFSDEYKTMVSTAFPSKISDYFASGRPIIGYAPNYSSVSQYFIKNKIPLLCTKKEDLTQTFKNIHLNDNKELIDKYKDIIANYHSRSSFVKKIL